MSLLFDLSDPNLKAKLAELRPTPGYCVFVDMVGSTALKNKPTLVWLSRIHDTFALIRTYFSKFPPLKMIGDCLMYYVPESSMLSSGGNALGKLFLPLCFVVQEENQDVFGKTKVAIAYCADAYEVSFLKGTQDVYGKDIDLTARLMSIANEGEIVMNEPFVERVRVDYESSWIKHEYPDVPKITGPWQEQFKGFEEKVNAYKLFAGGTSLRQQNYPRHFT